MLVFLPESLPISLQNVEESALCEQNLTLSSRTLLLCLAIAEVMRCSRFGRFGSGGFCALVWSHSAMSVSTDSGKLLM